MRTISYNRGDGIIELTLRDDTGSKIENFKCNISDKKSQKIISSLLKQKYNIDFTPEINAEYTEERGMFDY